MSRRRVSLVVNVHSSRAKRYVRRLPAWLAARGFFIDDSYTAHDEDDVRKYVGRSVKYGASLVIVGGGDGSLTTAVDVLAHQRTALGVLPLGTGNSFAQTLGIGTDVERALDVVAHGRIADVDLGRCNGTYFANFATIGMSSEIAKAAPHVLKPVLGPLAYAVGGVGPFLRHQPFSARLRWDSGETLLASQQMVVANGRYFGKQPVTPDASIVDGRLAFFTTRGVSRFDVAKMYLAFGLGRQTQLRDAVFFSTKTLSIKTAPKQLISIDGNALGKTPAHFSVAPGALRVCVPLDFADARD